MSSNFMIWLCWAIFLIVWAANVFGTKRAVHSSGWRWWNVVPVLSALALYFLNTTNIVPLLYSDLWSDNDSLTVISNLLAIAGLFILLWSRYTLGRNWSGHVVVKEDHELITTGPYAYVRHPIYTGLITLTLATAIALANTAGIIVLIIVFVSFLRKARAEETLLTAHFGQAYTDYKKRSKMILPFMI